MNWNSSNTVLKTRISRQIHISLNLKIKDPVSYLRKRNGLMSPASLPYGSMISKGQLPPRIDEDSVLTSQPQTKVRSLWAWITC